MIRNATIIIQSTESNSDDCEATEIHRLSSFLTEHYRQHGAMGYFLKCDMLHLFCSTLTFFWL